MTGVASWVGTYALAKKLPLLSIMLLLFKVTCFFSGELSILLMRSKSSMGLTMTPKDFAAIASLMSHLGNFYLNCDDEAWLVPLTYLVEPSHLGLKLSLLKEAVCEASVAGDLSFFNRAESGGGALLLSYKSGVCERLVS